MLFLIDLDGTLTNTDHLHYEAWSKVLDLPASYIKKIVSDHTINHILVDYPNPSSLRQYKIKEMLKFNDIELLRNADIFINYIVDNNINHVVVTNTDKTVVDHFKSRLPILNKLKNWVVREDYIRPKPDPECYKLAIHKYGDEDEKNIIGFENSREGINAITKVTDNVFRITPNTDYLKILDDIKLQCQRRYGTPQINLKHTERKR